MAWQQRNLARDHAQFRPARPAGRVRRRVVSAGRDRGLGQSRQYIVDGAAKVGVDRAAGHAIENENRGFPATVERLFRRADDVAEIAGRDAAVTLESDEWDVRPRVHENSPIFHRRYYPGKLLSSISSG